ncbi:MAG: hypothetical protein R3293_25125, partial [Candidatus Promineifilaceae bacterium]|nr:hypothetical protein [Candidatus Promineifilaceae bacterium]
MAPKSGRMLVIALVVSLFIVVVPGRNLLRAGESAHHDLDDVWQRVHQSGAYKYSADVTQTNTPQPTIVNAGRESKSNRIFMEGETDLDAESLQLTMWTGGGSVLSPESGVQIKVEGQTAMARQGAGDWEEIDDFTGLFAPEGDFLTYTRAAENVVRHAPETRSTALGEISFTRYTFDINGRRYAEYMRGQLKDQAVREGLPPGMQMELPRIYVEMTGTGELWVGADGLPLRQQFMLTFPETKDNYVT